jgi:protein tyrosine phosphatase
METLILAFESGTPIDPIQVVKLMRDQRMAMVQTDEQFVFACRAALAYYDAARK